MRCPEMMERLTDRLHGRLDELADRELSEHLAGCAACRTEAEQTVNMWGRLGRLEASEVPSARMRARLWAALSAYEDRRAGLGGRLRGALERLWPREPAWQLGFTAAALVVGLLAGAGLRRPSASGEIQALRGELRTMQQTISVSLLQHQSASERLRGVDLSTRGGPDDAVIGALLETVRHDTNVNVRLAAIEALTPVVGRPPVSRELMATVRRQDSTLVRASAAELLLRAGIDGAEQAVNEFLAEDQLEGPARDYLRTLMRRGQA